MRGAVALNRRTFAFGLTAAGAGGVGVVAAQTVVEQFHPNHPAYAVALEFLASERWVDLVSQINALPPSTACVLLDDLGDGAPIGDNLNPLKRVRGGRGVAGAILTGWAWRHRGSGETIVDERAFARVLVDAAEALMRAVRDDPNDGISAHYLFRCLKGAGERELLTGLLPTYLSAQRKPIQGLSGYADAISGKWLGSDEETLAFARSHATSALPGSFSVIPTAHVIVAVSRLMSGDPQVSQAAAGYFAQPDVAAEIIEAHDRFRVEAPDADEFAMRFAHGEFSYAFAQLRDLARMRDHLSEQGEFVSRSWQYLPNPHAAVRRVRAGLGLGAT